MGGRAVIASLTRPLLSRPYSSFHTTCHRSGGTTRSRFGWNNAANARRDDSHDDDYMFTEDGTVKSEPSSLGLRRQDSEPLQDMDEEEDEEVAEPSPVAARPAGGPAARQVPSNKHPNGRY